MEVRVGAGVVVRVRVGVGIGVFTGLLDFDQAQCEPSELTQNPL